MILAAEIDPHGISASMELRKDIYDIIMEYRPEKILETGTYNGLGSTSAILHGLKDAGVKGFSLISIECNTDNHYQALKNINRDEYDGHTLLLNAVSVPREILPLIIDDEYPEQVITDHKDSSKYLNEIPKGIIDDGIMTAMYIMEFKPDLVLLDSAGHLGEIEFDYLIPLVEKDFILILDDTKHRKHYNTMKKVRANPEKYKILKESDNKFGHAIIHVQ